MSKPTAIHSHKRFGTRCGSGAKFISLDDEKVTCKRCLALIHKEKEPIPKGATDLYAKGVAVCEARGLPLSALRVYYKINGLGFPVLYWVWSGRHWWLWERPYKRNVDSRECRKGLYAVFDTLNDAKEYGFERKETKLREGR